MLLKVHPANPSARHISIINETLADSGVIIYPTDTVYSLGCRLGDNKGFERLCRIKAVKPEKANFSLVCHDLSNISEYAQVDNVTFKLLKKCLPGPYTFILNASRNVPRLFQNNRKTVGIRIPSNEIALSIVRTLGEPIIATSVHHDDVILDYTTDPEEIHEKYQKLVDLVVDGGFGSNIPSTVIDLTSGEVEIIREGAGDTSVFT